MTRRSACWGGSARRETRQLRTARVRQRHLGRAPAIAVGANRRVLFAQTSWLFTNAFAMTSITRYASGFAMGVAARFNDAGFRKGYIAVRRVTWHAPRERPNAAASHRLYDRWVTRPLPLLTWDAILRSGDGRGRGRGSAMFETASSRGGGRIPLQSRIRRLPSAGVTEVAPGKNYLRSHDVRFPACPSVLSRLLAGGLRRLLIWTRLSKTIGPPHSFAADPKRLWSPLICATPSGGSLPSSLRSSLRARRAAWDGGSKLADGALILRSADPPFPAGFVRFSRFLQASSSAAGHR